jgi:hypothetical protein
MEGICPVYFPAKGEIILNIPDGKYEVRWLNILSSEWSEPLKRWNCPVN